MKLLITTQAVDRRDPILGFFHRWIEEFAKHCEKVTIVCLREGEHKLPPNVEVLSLGKEQGTSRLTRIVRFYRFIFSRRGEYDSVFVHMNPEYVVLGGMLWKALGKQVALWYVHKSVTLKLRLATLFVQRVFTASTESFCLKSPKVQIVGHGIDTELFSCSNRGSSAMMNIMTVGRIAPSKRIEAMVDAMRVLHEQDVPFTFRVIGGPVMATDREYDHLVRNRASALALHGGIEFMGPRTQQETAKLLCEADIFLNLSETGSLDKAVLEAMAAGVVPVSSNKAFRSVLEPMGLYAEDTAPEALATALQRARTVDPAPLRAWVAQEHSLAALIPRILNELHA